MSEELRLEIDPMRLDEEWQNQPSQFHAWAVQVVDAQAEYDQDKTTFEVVKANLDAEVRGSPEAYGVVKLTETVVSNTVISQPEYAAAAKKVHMSRHTLGIAQAAVDALEHRKRALSMYVELWIRDYYADPHVRAHTSKAESFEKRATEAEKKEVRGRGRKRVTE